MTEVLVARHFRGPAAEDAIGSIHNDMDSRWLDAAVTGSCSGRISPR
ncbi:hypothetical protein [Pseudarthrobacter sp. NamB4]|nr:hypothetical protein [Pseudarthrobacter sp. NamB4]